MRAIRSSTAWAAWERDPALRSHTNAKPVMTVGAPGSDLSRPTMANQSFDSLRSASWRLPSDLQACRCICHIG
ncbi:hypothetical protein OOJ09_30885 [Mesorhizobium qingshengii]|uniref:Uncharacterized protein n=1 Tax=Mesorhizobium qingshengii TaxID=1165689 RepID=A0ABT4R4P5_9HYPH|nr:hypothetical protein [Mesorhizobium qingshengii]MCZ8548589.1 hypothetical protein [Mesorhizobium qingshengii]